MLSNKQILDRLYYSSDLKWLNEIDSSVQIPVINLMLGFDEFCINYGSSFMSGVRNKLNKKRFKLPKKIWLAYAWSLIPKNIQYKLEIYYQKDEDESYDEIFVKIRKQLNLTNNDFEFLKNDIIKEIEKDKEYWFKYYGMNKEFWEKHNLDYSVIKNSKVIKGKSGLHLFG